MGLGRGLVGLFKQWGKGIGNAADHVWLGEEGQKAIRDEVIKKFQPRIDRFSKSESKRAKSIKELDDKYKASIDELQKKQEKWNTNYNSARDSKKQEMEKALDDWTKKGSDIDSNLIQAKKAREDYINNYMSDLNYDNTIFIDTSGRAFIIDPIKGFNKIPVDPKWLKRHKSYDTKFIGNDGKLVNLFDDNSVDSFTKALSPNNSQLFNYITSKKNFVRNAKEYKQLDEAVQNLETDKAKYASTSTPNTFNESQFKADYEKTNGSLPTGYSVNGQNYKDTADLDKAYQDAVNHLQTRKDYFQRKVSDSISERDAEIAKRIQDAKDIKKAKLFLGGTLGAGALYAGAKAMYGGDDTDNTDNIDTTDNTYTGEPDPELKAENTPDGKAALNGRPLKIDADFNPDEAAAVLASGAYDQGAEDSNSIESSDDLGNDIGASTRGHTMEDRLYELIKAMKDPYKADAIANYIYSRHGNDPEVQNLGWRGWLNKYYGDSLRKINIDPSGYKGMHVSGGL